jgi:hypothetical protein
VSRIRNNNFFFRKKFKGKKKKITKNIDKIKRMLIDMPNLRGGKEKTTKKFMKCFLQIFHSIVQL